MQCWPPAVSDFFFWRFMTLPELVGKGLENSTVTYHSSLLCKFLRDKKQKKNIKNKNKQANEKLGNNTWLVEENNFPHTIIIS